MVKDVILRSPLERRAGVWLGIVLVVAALALSGCGGSSSSAPPPTTTSMSHSTGTTASGGTVPKPVPIQTLGTATWQGMEILAQASTPLSFVVFDGTTMKTVKPPKNASMHLMVMLSDQHTGMALPYASVWATIRKGAKIVYDERQWPMISRYMGPHYGNDVTLPGKGTYSLTLLVSPPVSARHVEYAGVWLKPHRVTMTFHWAGTGSGA